MTSKKRTVYISLIFAIIMLVSAYLGYGTGYTQTILLFLIALWFIPFERLRNIKKRSA